MNECCKVGPVQYLGHTGSKNTFCSLIKYGIPYFTWKPSAKALLGLKSSSFCAFTKAHDIARILYAFILLTHELICLHLCLTWLSICCIKLLNKKGHTHTWWGNIGGARFWEEQYGLRRKGLTLDVGQRDVMFLPLSWEGGEKGGGQWRTSADEEHPLPYQ